MNSVTYNEHVALLTEGGFVLNPPEFNRLSGLFRTRFLLSMAGRSIDELIADENDTLSFEEFYARFLRLSHFLTQYGKCFGESGLGLRVLEADNVFRNQPLLRKAHDRIIELRDTVATHNGLSDLVLSGVSVKEQDGWLLVRNKISFALDRNEYPTWRSALEHASNYNGEEVNRVAEKLVNKLQKPIRILD